MRMKRKVTIDPAAERDLLDDINYYDVKCKHARSDADFCRYQEMKREKIRRKREKKRKEREKEGLFRSGRLLF